MIENQKEKKEIKEDKGPGSTNYWAHIVID